MDFANFFPIWDKLTAEQQNRIRSVAVFQKAPAGTILHDGSPDCLGMLLMRSGQLRAYILSEEGREITICRFFEMDICLFSASCVMPNMQFNIFIEAEKDSELWIIPACLYKNLMEESLPIAAYSNNLITSHFSDVMWLMEQIMWKSFDKRLASFLLDESALEGTSSLKITHEKIANHMGTAREVVTRMLRYFQSEDMVRLTRGTVDILDEKHLEELAE
jgi:CRP/FNR family transcriptional regulator